MSINYLPKEDCFVSIGSDNAIRVFAEGSKLRERFGHALPPSEFFNPFSEKFYFSKNRFEDLNKY